MKDLTKVSFFTLGCRLNQSETNVVRRSFEKDGYEIVNISEPADLVVINTCTVTENGDADTRRMVNKVTRLNPKTKIALIGCQAQVQKEKLAKMPNVRWIVGNGNKMSLNEIVKQYKNESKAQVLTPTINKKSFIVPLAGIDKEHTRANIKIQDGCDFFCSFCEIPYARGRARSRVFHDITKEARELVAAGHKELVITGINVGTYAYQDFTFMDVIYALEDIDGLERIRISSIEPTTIPDSLIKKMSSQSKLCRYLHIPLQSGDDRVLKDMKRKYTINEYSSFINDVYQSVPNICIGTDVIVGYPTEDDHSFNNTNTLLKDLPIHYFHVFSYSERHMAKSHESNREFTAQIKHQRSKILRQLSQRKRELFYQSQLNKVEKVLFEQKKDGDWTGLTDNYTKVKVSTDAELTNKLTTVKLKSVENGVIRADLV